MRIPKVTYLALYIFLAASQMSAKTTGAPVKIFYGLNESHSNSWVKMSSDGTIGLAYFQPDDSNSRTGDLVYKSISPNGTSTIEKVASGYGLEISVLIYDSYSKPHIFLAESDNSQQTIVHYQKNGNNEWESEEIVNWNNEGGKYIYELSGKIGPGDRFHLLVLKTRSNPDSGDYYYAFLNSNLYYITSTDNEWESHNIANYDMLYTCDEYVKGMNRQDIAIDKDGNAHIVYGEQLNGLTSFSPTRLNYVTNQSGNWRTETAVNYNYDTRDSGGWFPSIAFDQNETPYVSCAYIARVPTGSAASSSLILAKRIGYYNWQNETITSIDNGYYGSDGRRYTGGLTNLIFDKHNEPHILFTDIASSHSPSNCFNLGNIRHAVKSNDQWQISKIYTQPLPEGYYKATEMYSLSFLYNKNTNKLWAFGQEIVLEDENTYTFNLLELDLGVTSVESTDDEISMDFLLNQNYPNPFNPSTRISFSVPEISFGLSRNVSLKIYDILGNEIATLINSPLSPGNHEVIFDTTKFANELTSGIYFYRLCCGDYSVVKKMTLVR